MLFLRAIINSLFCIASFTLLSTSFVLLATLFYPDLSARKWERLFCCNGYVFAYYCLNCGFSSLLSYNDLLITFKGDLFKLF